MSGHSHCCDSPHSHAASCETPHHPHECAGHSHAVSISDGMGARLRITLLLNLIIPTAQVIAGLYAGSMALISDAMHNFSDFTAILIAYFTYLIGKKGASLTHSFGYRRAEALAALVNAALLTAACAYIIYEAVGRFQNPQPVIGDIVIWLALVGIAGNGLSAWLLHQDAAHSLNARGAFLHMMGDMLTSVAVLVSGLILKFKPWFWLDPLFSLIIVVFILKNCWDILSEAASVLMNATPREIDLLRVQKTIEDVPEVTGAHYLHAWHTGAGIAFSAHITTGDQLLSRVEKLAETIRGALRKIHGIDHAVLQFETQNCGNGGVLCEASCRGQGAAICAEEGQYSPMKEKIVKWGIIALRVGLGVVFIYASIDKIMHPKGFAEAVYNYQILPDPLVNLTAVILPVLELIVGVCLAAGLWVEGAVALINLMLVVFIAALSFNLFRGVSIQCGCFHAQAGEADKAEMIWTIVRDIGMLAAGLVIYFSIKERPAGGVQLE